jgi:hypothetical protein
MRSIVFTALMVWAAITYLAPTQNTEPKEAKGFDSSDSSFAAARTDCNIKGNISLNTGEHIYHVRGQEYYAATIITPSKGERWFCSEDEARAAGWRKAKQ